jgi:hypothetical protein
MQSLGSRECLDALRYDLFEHREGFHPFLTGGADSQMALEGTLFLWSQFAIEVCA